MTLGKISGVVQDLSISAGYEDFTFSISDRNTLGIVAAGAAAVGEIFSSTILSPAISGAPVSMEFFSCRIGGKLIVGKFHKVEFREGDEIEFIVEQGDELVIARAARSEEKRILWMLPYSARGYIAQRKFDLKWNLMLAVVAVIFMAVLEHVFVKPHLSKTLFYFAILYSGAFISTLVISAWARSRLYHFSESTTEVLLTLGYPNPETIDLGVIHKTAEKRLLKETNIYPPLIGAWCYRY